MPPPTLAKPSLDVGLYTNALADGMAFYGAALGLDYEELLKAGGGVHQHRYGLRGSVLKLNHVRAELPNAPTGFRRLLVAAQAGDTVAAMSDPDGLAVAIVEPGTDGVSRIGVEWHVPDVGRAIELCVEGLGAEPFGADRVRIGTTVLLLVEDRRRKSSGSLMARGFRYLTVQVMDTRAAHAELVRLGCTEAVAPKVLGAVALISFVLLPGGDWLEISQRASLTGPLPEL